MGYRGPSAVLLLLSLPGFCQETGPLQAAPAAPVTSDSTTAAPRAVALVVPRLRSGQQADEEAPFLRLLTAALGLDLGRAGLEAGMPGEPSLPELAEAPLERLLQQAAGADFLVLAGYTRTEETLRLEVEVLRVRGHQRIASASASRRIDLRLDEIVGPVVQQLLPQMKGHLAEAVRERERLAEAAKAAEQSERAVDPVAARPESLPAERTLLESPTEKSPRRLEIGAGGGIFFPMAELGPLFNFGYLTELYLERRSRMTAASLAWGLYTGFAGLLPAESGTAEYFGSLVPVGLSLRLGTPERSRLGVHVRLQAGAALNVSPQDKVGQRLTRVLPQAKAGAGLSLAINPRMGLSLEFLYELLLYMYMENGALAVEPIMGFNVPALFVYMRL